MKAIFLAAIAIAGCGGSKVTFGGGEGGLGGESNTPASSSSTGGEAGTINSTSGTSTGGSLAAGGNEGGSGGGFGGMSAGGQGGESTCDSVSIDCPACESCARLTMCANQYSSCTSNTYCFQLAQCYFQCNGSNSCENQCEQDNPLGVSVWHDFTDCVYCTACPVSCPGECV